MLKVLFLLLVLFLVVEHGLLLPLHALVDVASCGAATHRRLFWVVVVETGRAPPPPPATQTSHLVQIESYVVLVVDNGVRVAHRAIVAARRLDVKRAATLRAYCAVEGVVDYCARHRRLVRLVGQHALVQHRRQVTLHGFVTVVVIVFSDVEIGARSGALQVQSQLGAVRLERDVDVAVVVGCGCGCGCGASHALMLVANMRLVEGDLVVASNVGIEADVVRVLIISTESC